MVAVNNLSGLARSIWALASAPAIAPMVSLERCMGRLRRKQIKTDRGGLRAFGADAMPDRLSLLVRWTLKITRAGLIGKASRVALPDDVRVLQHIDPVSMRKGERHVLLPEQYGNRCGLP
jgi:hypothetical protein